MPVLRVRHAEVLEWVWFANTHYEVMYKCVAPPMPMATQIPPLTLSVHVLTVQHDACLGSLHLGGTAEAILDRQKLPVSHFGGHLVGGRNKKTFLPPGTGVMHGAAQQHHCRQRLAWHRPCRESGCCCRAGPSGETQDHSAWPFTWQVGRQSTCRSRSDLA